jgi:hypothetical protein
MPLANELIGVILVFSPFPFTGRVMRFTDK